MYRKRKVRGRRYKRRTKRYGRANKYRKYRTRKIAKKALRGLAKLRAMSKTAQYYHYFQVTTPTTGTAFKRCVPLLQPSTTATNGAWNGNPVFAQNPLGPANQERVWHNWVRMKLQWDVTDENEITNHSYFLIKPTKYGAQAVRAYTTGSVPTFTQNIDWVGVPGSIYLNPRLWKILWKKEFQSGDHLAAAGGVTGAQVETATAPRKVHREWNIKIKTNCIIEQFAQDGVSAAWNNGGQPRYVHQNLYLIWFTDDGTTDLEAVTTTMTNLNQVTYL